MTAISFDSQRIIEWNWWDNYGEVNLIEETINYDKLQIDCDVDAKCRLFKEAGDFYTPGVCEVQNIEVQVSNMQVYDEDGQPVSVTVEALEQIAKDIENYIATKL